MEMTVFNVQRTITPKVGNSELWFMCSACCLIMLYICVKFRENTTNGIRVMERTRVWLCSMFIGNNSVSRQIRVTVHVFCTSSHGDLHWCEGS